MLIVFTFFLNVFVFALLNSAFNPFDFTPYQSLDVLCVHVSTTYYSYMYVLPHHTFLSLKLICCTADLDEAAGSAKVYSALLLQSKFSFSTLCILPSFYIL